MLCSDGRCVMSLSLSRWLKKKNCSWLRIAFVCFFDLLELACSIDWFYICSRQHWFVSFGFISSLLRLCNVRSIAFCEIWSLVWCCTSTYSFSSHTSPHYCSIYIVITVVYTILIYIIYIYIDKMARGRNRYEISQSFIQNNSRMIIKYKQCVLIKSTAKFNAKSSEILRKPCFFTQLTQKCRPRFWLLLKNLMKMVSNNLSFIEVTESLFGSWLFFQLTMFDLEMIVFDKCLVVFVHY